MAAPETKPGTGRRTRPDVRRVALITGGSSPLGAAAALRLAADGFAVAVNHLDAQTATDAASVVEAIRARGGHAGAHAADVADPAAVEAMINAVVDQLGPPTVLVNNAAAATTSEISWDEITPEAWTRVQEVNVHGAFLRPRGVPRNWRKLEAAPSSTSRRSGRLSAQRVTCTTPSARQR